MSTWVAGADGCKNGWAVVMREIPSGEIQVRVAPRIEEMLRWPERMQAICIDIPIGLLDSAMPGGRDCDREARRLLGQPRARSVFSPPARPTLTAGDFAHALESNRASSPHGIGISRQAYGILGKIREVDEIMTEELQNRVFEVHPEVTFYALNGHQAVTMSKKRSAGRNERIDLLERAWSQPLRPLIEAHKKKTVARDDIIDAMAACWTAARILHREAVSLPDNPPRDSRGLRMEITR